MSGSTTTGARTIADRVAVLCATRLEWNLCAAAISAAGAGVVPICRT